MEYIKTEIINDIIALPSLFINGKLLGGFYYNGKPIENGLMYRNYDEHFQIEYPAPLIKHSNTINEQAIYGGLLYPHFGHFILESLSRIWAIRNNPDRMIVWKSTSETLFKWQKDILKLFNFDVNSSLIIKQSTLLSDFRIPNPGYIIQNEFSYEQAKSLGVFSPEKIISGKKLYLSRTRSKQQDGDFINEKELETCLKRRGWIIFYPEQNSVQEQLKAISSSEVVFGIEGSAFHSLIFFPHLKTKIFTITRNRKNHYSYNYNYDIIAKTKQLSFYQIAHEKVSSDNKLRINLIQDLLDISNDFLNSAKINANYLLSPPPLPELANNKLTDEIEIKDKIKYVLKYYKRRLF